MTDDQLDQLLDEAGDHERASAHARDQMFASLVRDAIAVAVRTHPETIRAALGSVFDLKALTRAFETQARILGARLQVLTERVEEQAALVNAVEQDVLRLDQQMDAIQYRLTKAARAFDQLARIARNLQEKAS